MAKYPLFLVLIFTFLSSFSRAEMPSQPPTAIGAWRIAGQPEQVMIVTEAYWTQTIHDPAQRQFVRTLGGTHQPEGDGVTCRIDFDSGDPQQVGSTFYVQAQVQGNELTLEQTDGTSVTWTRIDTGDNVLAGVWRMSGRYTDGAFSEMPLRARRTLKLLSGTRFQWVAMNVETGEFSGTGGGTFTFRDGKYTEHIEFFSRDGARVGTQLEFDGEIKEGNWQHRGLSSRGDPIHEVWTKFDPVRR